MLKSLKMYKVNMALFILNINAKKNNLVKYLFSSTTIK